MKIKPLGRFGETMSSIDVFNGFYSGKRVLVTGHTGFKGSWLSIWLHELGAEVIGVANDPLTERDNYVLSGIGKKMKADIRADIRDRSKLKKIFLEYRPEIVFHLAAQPLVRLSYDIPVETYETNVMGTIHEPMGGYDPYYSSKGATEIAIASWRRSFFNPTQYTKHNKSIASVRAGNVIGGGDWALDRIIPDCIRALEVGQTIDIRNPRAVRPWQHVLEPLSGYMLLAQKMWNEPIKYCEGWNFGPKLESISTVWEVATKIVEEYGDGELKDMSNMNALHEANLLMLDISKAKFQLGWEPRMNIDQCISLVIDWYKKYVSQSVYSLCVEEIEKYLCFKS